MVVPDIKTMLNTRFPPWASHKQKQEDGRLLEDGK